MCAGILQFFSTMEISSLQKLCEYLISSAIQRCRVSQDLCRLSVILKSHSHPSVARILISDTGSGDCLEDFQNIKLSENCAFPSDLWDGMISLTTTGKNDNEIFQYHLNLRESDHTRRLGRLPSYSKNGAKFSGSEVSISSSKTVDELREDITPFLRKIQILKIPMVAMELVVERVEMPGSSCHQFIQADDCLFSPSASSNIARLKLGFEDYVYKHGNSLDKKCLACFPSCEHLKSGSGMACGGESSRSKGIVIEAVIIISELLEPSASCKRAHGTKSKVLYFQDFSSCMIPGSVLKALGSIDWKGYGVRLKNTIEEDGDTLLEWTSLPAYTHLDLVLHCYQNQDHQTSNNMVSTLKFRNLVRDAVKFALDDLKETHTGALLSKRALKVRNFAPDLAKTIAGLITCSNDPSFRGECCSLLGLQSQEVGDDAMRDCIREKIVSVIEISDGKPPKHRVKAAPFLFQDY